ncbi:sigma-70 family RNA polymerase sigma factor [Congregibacter sp.]|uniref:sigma-70 family RNA polymerase sigma factor n=1 Tax=Congregibacter sp. TaxID=2744308 RepID=UPI003F6A8DC2
MIADEATLSRLMGLAQRGDKQAYTALLTEVQRWLERFFSRRCAPGHGDDLVQEVLIAVHKKRASYDPTRPFLPWLAAIARYRWIDHLRTVYRKAEEELTNADLPFASEEESIIARLSLDRMLAQIPNAQAEVISWVKIEGLSIKQAASKSGMSEAAVKINIHRGLKKLSALPEKAN